jgi:hypothetical protein
VVRKENSSLSCGGLLTLPIGFRVKGGLRGSTFKRPSTYPTLDLLNLFNTIDDPTLADQQEVFAQVTNLALEALDRLSANLLDAPLHNGRHVGIGIFARTNLCLKQIISRTGQEERIGVVYVFRMLTSCERKAFFC